METDTAIAIEKQYELWELFSCEEDFFPNEEFPLWELSFYLHIAKNDVNLAAYFKAVSMAKQSFKEKDFDGVKTWLRVAARYKYIWNMTKKRRG